MHKHLDILDSSEILCSILKCINDLSLYICLLVLALNENHQHFPSFIRDRTFEVRCEWKSMR